MPLGPVRSIKDAERREAKGMSGDLGAEAREGPRSFLFPVYGLGFGVWGLGFGG